MKNRMTFITFLGYISYCLTVLSFGCGDSEDLAYNLQDSGFTKIYVFKGGWLEWSNAGYPSETGI